MLADAIYLGEHEFEDQVAPLTNVEVYFDGPILLYMLGYGGQELAAPHVELLTLLKQEKAVLRCFIDSVIEAQHILDAAAAKVSTGESSNRFHGDVVSYLVRSGKTRSDIELMATELQSDLLRIGVQTVERPPPTLRLTTDETRLERMLAERMGYLNPRALRIDIDSVTAIYRLRDGRPAQSLDRTRAVFVTRNFGLVAVSAAFFEQRPFARAIPNCVHVSAFTTLVWLRRPLSAPELPKERIIADAFAAMNPSDRLWKVYNDEIDRLRESNVISDEHAHVLRLSEESRQVLMDTTLGDDNAYVEGTALEVLERSRQEMTASLRAEIEHERDGREDAERQMFEREAAIEQRGRKIGRLLARAVFIGLVPLLLIGLVFGALGPLNKAWTPLPTPLQVLCTVVAIALTLASVIAGASISSLVERVAVHAEGVVVTILRRLTR